jgi:hypothetical protein
MFGFTSSFKMDYPYSKFFYLISLKVNLNNYSTPFIFQALMPMSDFSLKGQIMLIVLGLLSLFVSDPSFILILCLFNSTFIKYDEKKCRMY